MMRIGIAADHDGFVLKVQLTAALKAVGYEVVDKIPDRQNAAKVRKSFAR
jgi:ribose 5-phosphate isomerase RpiB